ncbi:hypothetical protein, partial [Paenibacillus xylanivorans]|uniref:hypothetical protein n=1 Tax=Paenibacillus xylanivorans TaxID=1705561 RepID=UPI000A50D650
RRTSVLAIVIWIELQKIACRRLHVRNFLLFLPLVADFAVSDVGRSCFATLPYSIVDRSGNLKLLRDR